MKKLIVLSGLFLLSGISVASAQSEKAPKKKKTEEVTFVVSMNCHNCQSKIEKNIPWEKGVKDLKVDLEKKTVCIVYNPKQTTEETLKKAIEKLDFTCEKAE
ncbi:MAG: heavy-metal-associated domain-containing protein [Prevotellaceae bacterium]|jgi:copper chaperone CopZ|nr:heavy-metal-associated domain-containing protein [Prevotellaceae bacterium]